MVRWQCLFGRAHSDDVLLRSVPDRSRVEIGNLVEEHLCRLIVQSALFAFQKHVELCLVLVLLCLCFYIYFVVLAELFFFFGDHWGINSEWGRNWTIFWIFIWTHGKFLTVFRHSRTELRGCGSCRILLPWLQKGNRDDQLLFILRGLFPFWFLHIISCTITVLLFLMIQQSFFIIFIVNPIF
jgi:hypothetical protein